MKDRTILALCGIAVFVGSALLFGLAAVSGHADANLPNIAPHRHWINGVQVGPDLCDNRDNPGIQQAFNEFHSNLHRLVVVGGVNYSTGPVAPGLHNGQGGELTATGC